MIFIVDLQSRFGGEWRDSGIPSGDLDDVFTIYIRYLARIFLRHREERSAHALSEGPNFSGRGRNWRAPNGDQRNFFPEINQTIPIHAAGAATFPAEPDLASFFALSKILS
ncbi:MAG: hypothetical protein K8H74_13105 [Notoacmeibacter sp.]|nr:hypothetical protein [Notoacmeibacter sp.]